MPQKILHPQLTVINLAMEGATSTEPYRNVVINRVNESCLRLAAFEVEYRWHFHADSDELFIVVDGTLEIDFVNAPTLHLTSWDMITIPAGTVHRTRARGRTVNLTFEHLETATTFVDDPL
jgi:mannose-6-phosphate isomerase-like protein (cupin superfamily)